VHGNDNNWLLRQSGARDFLSNEVVKQANSTLFENVEAFVERRKERLKEDYAKILPAKFKDLE